MEPFGANKIWPGPSPPVDRQKKKTSTSSTTTRWSRPASPRCLAPAELAVHVTGGILRGPVQLPCFDRTTSIKLNLYFVGFTLPPAGGFPALESLDLENGRIDLSDLLPRCPRLRKLFIPFWNSDSIVVRSPSLEEFSVQANFNIAQLEIVAPALKRLYLDAHRGIHKDCNVVFAEPAVEDLTWKCECKALTYRFGVIWRMWSLTFENTQLANDIDSQSVCLQSQHCPRVGVLSLSLETNVRLLSCLFLLLHWTKLIFFFTACFPICCIGFVRRCIQDLRARDIPISSYWLFCFGAGSHTTRTCLWSNRPPSSWPLYFYTKA